MNLRLQVLHATVFIIETPDLVLERNLSSGLPEQVPGDVLSNRSLAVPQGCCVRFPRASVDILRVGQCAPSRGSAYRGLRLRETGCK